MSKFNHSQALCPGRLRMAVVVAAAVAACLFAACLAIAVPVPGAHSAQIAYAAESSSAESPDPDDDNASDESDSPDDANLVDPTQRADNSFIYDTTIESLFKESSRYDQDTVQVVGEAIGDKVAADKPGYCWITLTSTIEENPETISVLLTEEQANQIDHFGRYNVTGTTFQVRGSYHQACSEHAGLPDIHATDSATIKRGIEEPDHFRLRRFVPGAALIVVGLLLMGVYYFVREKTR